MALRGGLPAEAQHATVVIDVQKDWLSALATAWARPDRGWALERREFHGGSCGPGEEAWARWAAWMRERWAGCRLALTVGIDVGYQQSVVLAAVRQLCLRRGLPRARGRYVPCKGGSGGLDAPVFRMSRTPPRLAIVGQSVKRWQIMALETGRVAVADSIEDEVLRELASEEIRTTRRGRQELRQSGPNEAADCLSYAAALWFGMTGNTLR